MKKYKVIIAAGGKDYTLVATADGDPPEGMPATAAIVKRIKASILAGDTLYSSEGAIDIEPTAYQGMEVREITDDPQPLIADPPKAPAPDLSKEYDVVNVESRYLGQNMDASLLVYYAGPNVVVMPTMINGAAAYNYMKEQNVVEFTHKLAQGSLQLAPTTYSVLLYPGPLLDLDDGVEYVREWLKANAPAYVPKSKNAKAFIGWNERV